ncbi:MAG TPA: hypothetical protein VKR23_16115 [Gaiellaceae bacterium]|nr:hypothetical protein [Gaiellaceae bacterium]
MSTIYPTFTCFDDALEFINVRVKQDQRLAFDRTLTLVHGIALAHTAPNEPYAHAWVEEGDRCWDAGLVDGQKVYYAVARDEFYAARRIQKTTCYTVRQACLENFRTKHYGPWRAEYAALCGSGRRVLGKIDATVALDALEHER